MLETARGGLLKRGMGYKRANVGAVLNVQADHLGLRGIDTLEDLAKVKRIIVEVATDVPRCSTPTTPCACKMADYSKADHLCYVTMNPKHPLVREHIRSGGRAVVLEEGINGHMITFYDRGSSHPAAVDAPDPGDPRGAGDAQRPERHVRRRRRLQHGGRAWKRSATACAPSTPRSSRPPGA